LSTIVIVPNRSYRYEVYKIQSLCRGDDDRDRSARSNSYPGHQIQPVLITSEHALRGGFGAS
jgi:hypothetical protein